MLQKDINLTILGTIPTTKATPLNAKATVNLRNKFNLTFTGIYDQDKLFSEIAEKLARLEMKETVSEKELSIFLPMISNLTPGSDNRLECDARIRFLMKRFIFPIVEKKNLQNSVLEHEKILQTVNQSNDINEVYAALIELDDKEYVNLGREGRLSVAKQLVQSEKLYQTVQELVDDLQARTKHMNGILSTINVVKEKADYIQLLEEMKLPLYMSLSLEVKEVVVDYLLHQNVLYNSISSLANAIAKIHQTTDMISDTISMDNPCVRKLIKSEVDSQLALSSLSFLHMPK